MSNETNHPSSGTKLLTLCVAVYDMEQFLARCLDSVCIGDERLRPLLEVLVVDDGSTDGSASLAQRYADRWPETYRLIRKANGQYGSCVNRALDEARGLYFRMLDADDWMNTQALEALLAHIASVDALPDLLVTKFTRHTPIGPYSHRDEPVSLQYDHTYSVEQMVTFMPDVWPSSYVMHNMTYRTALLRQMPLRLQEGIYYTDTEYVFYPLYHLQTVQYLDLDLYQYDMTREGQTTQMSVTYSHRHDLERLVTMCVQHYLSQRDSRTPAFNRMAVLLLTFMIRAFYMAICLGHRQSDHGEDRQMIAKMDKLLLQDPALYAITTRRRYNMLPYVAIVRRLGWWPYTGVYGIYSRIVDGTKRIIGRRRKKWE